MELVTFFIKINVFEDEWGHFFHYLGHFSVGATWVSIGGVIRKNCEITPYAYSVLFGLSSWKAEIWYAYCSYKLESNDMYICGSTPHGAAKRPLLGAEGPHM